MFKRRISLLVPLAGLLTTAFACSDRPPERACPDCEIQLEHLVTLGETGDGPGALPSWATSIARDSKGRYFVTAPYTGEERPYVFEASGAFLRRLGGIGEGPGELQSADFLSVSADSVMVYDNDGARITVFDPNLEYVRSMPGIPLLYSWVELSDGTLVANGMDHRVPPMIRYDRTGEVLAKFGDVYEEFDPSTWLRSFRHLAPGPEGTVWSATGPFSITLKQWKPSGQLRRVLEIHSDWFAAFEEPHSPSPDEPPQSSITGIWEDEPGLLWVVGLVADPDWADGLGSLHKVEGQEAYEIPDPTRVWDAVIEVIDPDARQPILYHRRIPDRLFSVQVPGVLAWAEETDLGFFRMHLFQATITKQPAP